MRKSGARRYQRLSSQTLSQENKLRGVLGVVQPRSQYLNINSPIYPAGPERIIEIICKETTYVVLAVPGDVISGELCTLLTTAHKRSESNRLRDAGILLDRAGNWFWNEMVARPAIALLCLLDGQATSGSCSTDCNRLLFMRSIDMHSNLPRCCSGSNTPRRL
jgi:hypothetical protein